MRDKFIDKIWDWLPGKLQQAICRDLNIVYKEDAYELFKEEVPVAVAYLAMKRYGGKIRYKYLRLGSLRETARLTYDRDGWGARRERSEPLGLFNAVKGLSEREKEDLEWALKSTLLMNCDAKIYFIESAVTMDPSMLRGVISLVESEMFAVDERFRDAFDPHYSGEEDIRAKIAKNVEEWREIEKRYVGHKVHQPHSDRENDLLPYKIVENLRQYVIGQDEALKSIATALYYQKKIYRALAKEKPVPFETLRPMLISGQTGSGKTYLIRKACEFMEIPYVIVDASAMVSTGIRGMSIDEVVKTILRKCDMNVKKAEGAVVVFDEIDKLVGGELYYGETLMSQLLRFVEGGEYAIEKGNSEEFSEFSGIKSLRTDHMLFVFAGSFQKFYDNERKNRSGFIREEKSSTSYENMYRQMVEKSGLKKELLGRIGEIVVLNPLNKETLVKILTESKDSPVERYRHMLRYVGTEYTPDDKTIETIAAQAYKMGYGARGLEKLVYAHFKERLLMSSESRSEKREPKETFTFLMERISKEIQ